MIRLLLVGLLLWGCTGSDGRSSATPSMHLPHLSERRRSRTALRLAERDAAADDLERRTGSGPLAESPCVRGVEPAHTVGRGVVFSVWVANYYSARNPLRLSSLVILGVVARMFRCATRSSCWCT